jgi:hypothetical protein
MGKNAFLNRMFIRTYTNMDKRTVDGNFLPTLPSGQHVQNGGA